MVKYFAFFSSSAVSGGLSLQSSLTIHDATNLEFLGMKSLRYMDFSAILNGLPSLCYTSGLEKVLPIRRQNVKDPAQCGKEKDRVHWRIFLLLLNYSKEVIGMLFDEKLVASNYDQIVNSIFL